MNVIIALSPLIVLFLLLFVGKISLLKSSILSAIYTLTLGFFYWKVYPLVIGAGILKGFLVAFDITVIVLGALLFLHFLKRTNRITYLEELLLSISSNKSSQIVFITWFFAAFLEGSAGFGTPAAIIAPLLLGLGVPAVTAIALPLIADSTAVIFGAIGTPIRVGFESLDVTGVVQTAGLINIIPGMILPLLMLLILEYTTKKSFADVPKQIPFALACGFFFLIPFWLLTFVGNEYPSFLGSLIGAGLMLAFSRLATKQPFQTQKVAYTFFPYLIFVGFLFAGKYLPTTVIRLSETITHKLSLYNPGLFLLLTILIFSVYQKWNYRASLVDVKSKLLKPFLAILSLTVLVQILIHSHQNASGFVSMLQSIAIIPSIYVVPFLGAFDAFLAGSATVSNLLFGNIVAVSVEKTSLALALLVSGAAIGNMISLTNIITAQAAVGHSGDERAILGLTIIPCLIYLGLLCLVVFLFF